MFNHAFQEYAVSVPSALPKPIAALLGLDSCYGGSSLLNRCLQGNTFEGCRKGPINTLRA